MVRVRRTAGPTTAVLVLVLVTVLVLVLAGCSAAGDAAGGRGQAGDRPAPDGQEAEAVPSVDPLTPTGWGPTEGELARARDVVASMSLEHQILTVLMPGFWGYDGERPTPAEAAANRQMHGPEGADSAAELLAARPHAGLFLRPEVIRDADQVRALAGALHDAGDGPDGLPLLVAIDQEGGAVQRLRTGVPAVPSAAAVGATGDPGHARAVARRNGATLRRLGVTMVFAPVADVDPDGRSALGSRTYSRDVDRAAAMVTASVGGFLDAGVLPVVKHFPGLGSVRGDSHRLLPVQTKSLEALRRTDLVPFAAAVAAGAPVVMTGHVAVRALDPGMPASLSPTVLTALLRQELGFEGVAVTDSQGMDPVNGRFGPGEGAVRSLLAGNDLVLNSPKPARARVAVARAVAEGRLPASRVAEAATRVTALRLYLARLAAD